MSSDNPNINLDRLAGAKLDATVPVKILSGSGGAATIADGADVAEGTTTDTAVQGDTLGTISAKLRGINIALQQLQQAQARNTQAQMAQFTQQPGAGFVVSPEVPAFLGGF